MYKTLEEANKAASEEQWKSEAFPKDIDTQNFKQRMQICKSCDKLTILNVCSQCGCFMPIKTRLKSSYCPIGKWNVVITTQTNKT